MKRALVAMVLGVFGWAGQAAQAQFQQPGGGGGGGLPFVSPYQLLGRGTPATQLYTLIGPTQQFRSQISQLQQGGGLENREWTTGMSEYVPTGHASGFQTQMKYFGTIGPARMGATGGSFGSMGGGQRGGGVGGAGGAGGIGGVGPGSIGQPGTSGAFTPRY